MRHSAFLFLVYTRLLAAQERHLTYKHPPTSHLVAGKDLPGLIGPIGHEGEAGNTGRKRSRDSPGPEGTTDPVHIAKVKMRRVGRDWVPGNR